MMLPTHVLVGLAVAAPLALLAPEDALWILAGATAGSVLPDLDMYVGHRRTLHFPTLYPVAAGLVALPAAVTRSAWLLALVLLLLAAAIHCRMDRYGGGLEFKPWEARSDRAVYDHVRGRWRAPKRWVRYDGAPEDVALAVVIGIPLWLVLEAPFQWLVIAALLVGGAYGLVRRRLPDLAVVIVSLSPPQLRRHVPGRYRKTGD